MELQDSAFASSFGAAAADYGRHRAGFPEAFFQRLAAKGLGAAGQRVVDLGTGTGTLARHFAADGCHVTGLDADPRMLGEARRLADAAGPAVTWLEARAELTGLADTSADLVIAGQCWHWFRKAEAAGEAHRLLRPGGHLVIASFDWIPLPGNLVDATERLIEAHNPDWRLGGGVGLYPQYLKGLSMAGFVDLETFSFDVGTPYTPTGWRGRIRASAGIAALGEDAVMRFDAELAELLARDFPGEALTAHHRVSAIIGRRPP